MKRLKTILGFFVLILFCSVANADLEYHSGSSFTGQPGICEHVDLIMKRSKHLLEQTNAVKPIVRKSHLINRQNLPQHPESSALERRFMENYEQTSQATNNLAARTQPVQQIGLNFLAAQYSESGFVPPDADGAVGPQQYFVVASGIVKTFNKSTGALDGVIDTSLDNFFASVLPAGSFVGDIRAFYDTGSQRFFVLGRTSDTATERMVIAVSNSSIISHQSYFTFYYITTAGFTGGLELDYPSLGIDSNAILAGANLFNSQGNFVNSMALVIQKSSLLGAGPVHYTVFNNLINFNTGSGQVSPQGVTNYASASAKLYSRNKRILFWRFSS